MLNLEIQARELLLNEKKELVDRFDDLSNMLNADAELVLLKQELHKQKEKEGDSFVVANVMSSLGAKLEEKERELLQKDSELALLRKVETTISSVEIHEKC